MQGPRLEVCRGARSAYPQPGHVGATFQNTQYRTPLLRTIRRAAGTLDAPCVFPLECPVPRDSAPSLHQEDQA